MTNAQTQTKTRLRIGQTYEVAGYERVATYIGNFNGWAAFRSTMLADTHFTRPGGAVAGRLYTPPAR